MSGRGGGQTFVVVRSFVFPAPSTVAEELLLQLHHVPGHVEPCREDLGHVGGCRERIPRIGRRRPGPVGHLLHGALHAAGLTAGLATVTELAAVSVPLLAALGALRRSARGASCSVRRSESRSIAVVLLIAVVAVAVAHQILLAAQVVLAARAVPLGVGWLPPVRRVAVDGRFAA